MDAALQLIDEQGVGALSLRGVGSRLGYEAMALYRYVANRDDLLDAVAAQVVGELDRDPEVDLYPRHGWQDYLARLVHGVRRCALRHPHAFSIVATRPSQTPWIDPPLRSLRWIESLVTALSDQGFTDEQVLFVYRSLNSFLLGFLLLETSALTTADREAGDGAPSSPLGARAVAVQTAVPDALSWSRASAERRLIADADQLDPPDGNVPAEQYPGVQRLVAGLAQDVWFAEFDAGFEALVDRIGRFRGMSE